MFCVGGYEVFVTKLIEGFHCSHMLFHSIISRVLKWGRQQDANVKANHYVDDLKILATIMWEHNKQVIIVVKILDIFGFKLNVQKLQLLELQITFLGRCCHKGNMGCKNIGINCRTDTVKLKGDKPYRKLYVR